MWKILLVGINTAAFHMTLLFMSIFEVCFFENYNILLRGCTSMFFIQGGLNLSSSQPQPKPPDNRTIQNFVKDYVDTYMGEYTM